MTRSRGGRRRRSGRAPDATAEATPSSTRAPSTSATRVSRIGIAFALFLGLFLGRVFSDNFSASTLGLVDLLIFAGLAATMALAFRRWARRTIEDRERQRRRRKRREQAPERPPAEQPSDEDAPRP